MAENFVDLAGTIGAVLLFAFMAAFIVTYSLGLKKNKQLLEKYYTLVNEWVKTRFKVVDRRVYKFNGFRLKCVSTDIPLERLDVSLYLANRENPLYYIVSKAKPRYDVFVCEAYFKARPRFSMEIFNPKKVVLDCSMETVAKIGELEVRAPGADAVLNLLEDIKEHVESLKDIIIRVSLRSGKPHLIYSFVANESKLVSALSLVEKIGWHFRPVRPRPKFLEG
ncbi:MAG: hypothetical protein QXK94_09085 [Candidatus Jordarchaeales archaeon]